MKQTSFPMPSHLKLGHADETVFLTFRALENFPLVYASFLRHGGVSKGIIASLNLGSISADTLKNLRANRAILLKAMGQKECYFLNQRHGTVLHEATDPSKTHQFAGDGLYTNVPNTVLLIRHADCQGAVFYDSVNHAIAHIHCGWKGLVANIYKVTVNKLRERYGSHPKDLIVCIAPSLRSCHAEYKTYEKIFPSSFRKFLSKEAHFDFLKIATTQLTDIGLSESNIHTTGLCSYCYPEDFFSFRRDHISANNASVVFLKSKH